MISDTQKEIILEVKDVEVNFLYQNVSSIKQYLFSFGRENMFNKKKVLNGIDLTLYKGDSLALFGKNGCGKSTFLRVLAGIISPDKGKVKVYGKIAPVLALGVGFELEMTGYENIKLLGSLIGMSKKEIAASMNYIYEFSELGDALGMQVKRYSSGMMARLGFSIATAGVPDILIIDEALAVGDKGFQDKCIKRILEIKAKGGTLIFVSHHYEEVKQFCTKGAYLNNGRLERIGDVEEIGNYYLSQFQ